LVRYDSGYYNKGLKISITHVINLKISIPSIITPQFLVMRLLTSCIEMPTLPTGRAMLGNPDLVVAIIRRF